MRYRVLSPRLILSGIAAICVSGVAVVLATVFHTAPLEPSETQRILRSAAYSADSRTAYYKQYQSQLLVAAGNVNENKMIDWEFSDGVPEGWNWTHLANIQPRSQTGTTIRTTPKNFEQQLRSPAVSLGVGEYDVVVEGVVIRGGLALGAERGLTCIGNSFFSADQWRERSGTRPIMVRHLRIRGEKPVHFVLSNWSYSDDASVWNIKRVLVRRRPPRDRTASRYAALASPLTRMNLFSVLNTRFNWKFAGTVPQDWFETQDIRVKPTQSAVMASTGRNTYKYELITKVTLGKGPYLFRVHGRILQGGLSIGAVDVRTNKWLGQRFYWYGQNGAPGAMAVPFSVKRAGGVELVIANWAVTPSMSTWLLRGAELDQRF